MRRTGALSGVLAAAVTLGIGELAAGLLPRVSSPVVAVADAVVQYAPGSTARTAIRVVGTADKPLLLVAVVVVWLTVGALVGLTVPRWRAAAIATFVLVGGAGGLAVGRERGASTFLVILASIVASAGGVGALIVLEDAATASAAGRDKPASNSFGVAVDRRRFLRLAGGTAAVAVATATTGRFLNARVGAAAARLRAAVHLPRPTNAVAAPAASASVPVRGVSRLITPNDAFYRIDTTLVTPRIDPAGWRLRISGMVRRPFTVSFDELLAMPMVEEYVTLACVSNEVGGPLVGTARWLGVPLATLLDRAGPDRQASQIVGRDATGFSVGFPTKVGLDGRTALVAVGMNGEPLPFAHGFPARLVVAGLYGYCSAAKWLTEIELTTLERFDAFWVQRGWVQTAPILTQSRIDVVRLAHAADTVIPGSDTRLVAAGVAWAPTNGITRVQLQLDDGPWNEARLASELDPETWRQWRSEVDVPPGQHRLRVRATDGRGRVQTSRVRAPEPDAATGYHTIVVQVRDQSAAP